MRSLETTNRMVNSIYLDDAELLSQERMLGSFRKRFDNA